jgi:hypothetical protein
MSSGMWSGMSPTPVPSTSSKDSYNYYSSYTSVGPSFCTHIVILWARRIEANIFSVITVCRRGGAITTRSTSAMITRSHARRGWAASTSMPLSATLRESPALVISLSTQAELKWLLCLNAITTHADRGAVRVLIPDTIVWLSITVDSKQAMRQSAILAIPLAVMWLIFCAFTAWHQRQCKEQIGASQPLHSSN